MIARRSDCLQKMEESIEGSEKAHDSGDVAAAAKYTGMAPPEKQQCHEPLTNGRNSGKRK